MASSRGDVRERQTSGSVQQTTVETQAQGESSPFPVTYLPAIVHQHMLTCELGLSVVVAAANFLMR
jgi:hypothetical protein